MQDSIDNQKYLKTGECLVCYTTNAQSRVIYLPCGCESCVSCVTQWTIVKLQDSPGVQDLQIPCLTNKCIMTFSLRELLGQLPLEGQNKINEALLHLYLTRESDISKCPNPKCSFAGVIDKKTCQNSLECDACGALWRDYRQFTLIERIKRQTVLSLRSKNELLSGIAKYLISKRCPGCKVQIEKLDGCDHMTCSQCKYEFCWICKQQTSHNNKLHHLQKIKQGALFILGGVSFIFALYLLYLFPPVNFLCNWTIIPVLSFFKMTTLKIFYSFKAFCSMAFPVIGYFLLLNSTMVYSMVAFDKRMNLQKKVGAGLAALFSCFLIYYFEVGWKVLKCGLFECAAGFFINGMCWLKKKFMPK